MQCDGVTLETIAIVGAHPVLILIETMARIDPGCSGGLFVAFGTPLSTFRLTGGESAVDKLLSGRLGILCSTL